MKSWTVSIEHNPGAFGGSHPAGRIAMPDHDAYSDDPLPSLHCHV